MEEHLAAVWAVCRFPASRNSVDTDPVEPQVALAVSVDAAAVAREVVVAYASVEIPSESEARIFAMPGMPHSAHRCAVADCVDASVRTLFVPSWATVDSVRWDRA